jgi:Lamin Tail Domain
MLISDFSQTYHVKTLSRIIIGHINHNPNVKDRSDKLNEEFVVLENEGDKKVSLAGWSLMDETATGERRHIYKFPQTVALSPREKAYVHTGPGNDLFEKGNPPRWNLHWGRHSFVWNNEGDTATLFDADGNKVDSLQVVTIKAT